MEHEVFFDGITNRFWKSTYPGQSGFGPSGYFTPAGYLRRLRYSNLIFNDDVSFEGILVREKLLSIVTSQKHIQTHPTRFIPSKEEIESYLRYLSFTPITETTWERKDGIEIGDCHNRNFIRTPDEEIIAIDVQPILRPGHDPDNIIPHPDFS